MEFNTLVRHLWEISTDSNENDKISRLGVHVSRIVVRRVVDDVIVLVFRPGPDRARVSPLWNGCALVFSSACRPQRRCQVPMPKRKIPPPPKKRLLVSSENPSSLYIMIDVLSEYQPSFDHTDLFSLHEAESILMPLNGGQS